MQLTKSQTQHVETKSILYNSQKSTLKHFSREFNIRLIWNFR